MGQRHRFDRAGERYHVMNRGIAKRTIAENARDAECFFENLADVVEAGLVTIDAAALMTTHFHLLLCSVVGEFWRAMRQFQNGHSRAFNRARRRDGPLFRGRYRSRLVSTEAYWVNVVRYIDHNPVAGGLVKSPEQHPFGSARHFMRGTTSPWLDRTRVEGYVRGWTGSASFRASDYQAMFGRPPASPALIKRRLFRGERGDDSLARLLPASPSRTLDWMTWKSRLADGTSPGDPVCTPQTIEALVAVSAERSPDTRVRLRRNRVSVWPLIRIGLLRTACGCRLSEIATRVGTSTSTVHGRARTHDELIRKDREYAAAAAAILGDALEIDWRVGATDPGAPSSGLAEAKRRAR